MTALLFAALVAGIGCAVVLAVYRSGDIERVARECAHSAVAQEREQVHRMLIANATLLRKSGRRQHAATVDQLLGLLKARPLHIDVNVRAFTKRLPRKPGFLEKRASATLSRAAGFATVALMAAILAGVAVGLLVAVACHAAGLNAGGWALVALAAGAGESALVLRALGSGT